MTRTALGSDEEFVEVWTPASTQAFSDLLNRALDRPVEQMRLEENLTGTVRFIVQTTWKVPDASLGTVDAPRRALPASGHAPLHLFP